MTVTTRLPSRTILSLLLVCAALPHGAHAADDDSIATDRPDFVESSNVVGKGRFQVETSIGMDRSKSAGVREQAWATPTLLRYGISENLEVRLESDGLIRQRISDASTGLTYRERGTGDLSLGMKWHAMDAVGTMPSVGVLLHADLDSGSTAFRGNGTRPSARMVAEWDLASEMSLGVMPGIGYDRDAGGTFGILGVVLGKGWSDKFRSFIELSSPRIAKRADAGTEASATVGVAYLITNNCQVDSAVSRGLNNRTPDLSMTVGLSFKL